MAADPFVDAYFGGEDQQALLRRGRTMFALAEGDRRFSYYGRTVGLAGPQFGSVAMLAALARLQGNGSVIDLPEADLARWRAEAEALGLSPVVYANWAGGAEAMTAAAEILRAHPLPDDLSLAWIDAETPAETLARLAELSLACGVLPPAGSVLRGVTRPGLALVALDAAGRAVSCAAAVAYFQGDHPKVTQCWWGMLATLPERRGQRLALILGAMAMLAARDRFGFTSVFTGVEPGNAASEAVCGRLGLAREPLSVLGVADPGLLRGGRMTK
jgi:hypothetical protein